MVAKGLRFEIGWDGSLVIGEPRYVEEDYAFDFRMSSAEKERLTGPQGATSFVTGTLQLEVAVCNGRCLYVWGYCPIGGWSRAVLGAPVARRGSLTARCDKPLIRGVSIGIEEMIPPTAWFDPQSGWFCMGSKGHISGGRAVEFATDTVAVVTEGRIASLWVKPANWAELAEKLSGGG